MKRHFLKLTLVVVALSFAGGVEARYPVSGETCGPDDPVHTLDANDCVVAT